MNAAHCALNYESGSLEGFAFDRTKPINVQNCFEADPFLMKAVNAPSGTLGTLDGYYNVGQLAVSTSCKYSRA